MHAKPVKVCKENTNVQQTRKRELNSKIKIKRKYFWANQKEKQTLNATQNMIQHIYSYHTNRQNI